MRRHAFSAALVALALALALVPRAALAVPQRFIKAKYLYQLSDNTHALGTSWAPLSYDAKHKELYVVDLHDSTVGIFNDVGMEIYRFGDDADVGTILGIDATDDGDLLVLAMDKSKTVVRRCNFRGELKETIALRDVPEQFAKDFVPDEIAFRGGHIYLAQKGTMKLLVTDPSGSTLEAHDYFHELGLAGMKELRGGCPGMRGFSVAGDGTILFTVAPMFKVFVISPDGRVGSFGQKGGAPGKFNITGGVVQDDRGRIFVSDVLKCAVLVFDPTFEFLGQFGERGWDDGDLIGPQDLAIAGDKLFVSLGGGRGVSVFDVSSLDDPPPPPPPQQQQAAAQ